MDLKKAKILVDEMFDLCSQLQDETFTETCTGIYNDVKAAKSIENLITSATELMVFVNEAPWYDYGIPEVRDEVECIFNNILEEYEEF